MSQDVRAFCNGESIKIIKSLVIDQRATSCVERKVDSLKNSISFFREKEKSGTVRKRSPHLMFLKQFNIKTFAIQGTPWELSQHTAK